MAMEQSKKMKIVEVCNITPSSSETEFSLPLTYFDLMSLHMSPIEYIFFYCLTIDDPPFFDSILPKLKHSLSLILSYFLPLAGNLTWPDDSPEPFILYKPGDVVSLTVAATDADQFCRLSANCIQKATESHCLLPELKLSDGSTAPAMSLQITLFPNTGFSIGIKTNHVVVDGKTTTMFMKSWASICKLNLLNLPSELTPFFDRSAVKDPTGIDALYVKNFTLITSFDSKSKDKKLSLPSNPLISQQDATKCIFELTPTDIQNLRKKVATSKNSHLSSFVLTFAYISTCMIKAQKIDNKSKIALIFAVDWRPRSELSIPLNYFGNGVSQINAFVEGSEYEEENGVEIVANKISDAIAELEEMAKKCGAVEIIEKVFFKWVKENPVAKVIAVSGSPRFGVYEVDFGWGSCEKVEMTAVSLGDTISLVDSRNGNGGIEVSIALPNDAMNVFASLFSEGLK